MLHEYHKGGTYSKRESKDSNELGRYWILRHRNVSLRYLVMTSDTNISQRTRYLSFEHNVLKWFTLIDSCLSPQQSLVSPICYTTRSHDCNMQQGMYYTVRNNEIPISKRYFSAEVHSFFSTRVFEKGQSRYE